MAIRLTTQTLQNMRGNTPLFVALVKEFNLSTLQSIRRWMRENKPNGPLTSKAALQTISKSLNVPEKYLFETVNHEPNDTGVPDPSPALAGQNCETDS